MVRADGHRLIPKDDGPEAFNECPGSEGVPKERRYINTRFKEHSHKWSDLIQMPC